MTFPVDVSKNSIDKVDSSVSVKRNRRGKSLRRGAAHPSAKDEIYITISKLLTVHGCLEFAARSVLSLAERHTMARYRSRRAIVQRPFSTQIGITYPGVGTATIMTTKVYKISNCINETLSISSTYLSKPILGWIKVSEHLVDLTLSSFRCREQLSGQSLVATV